MLRMPQTEITDIVTLRAAVSVGWRPKYLYFWGHTANGEQIGKHVLSQWWPSTFDVDDLTYSSAEQFMMAEKARLFGDELTRQRIMANSSPRKVKALGRTISNFVGHVWSENRFDIVVRGNVAKFGQNEQLSDYLASTGASVLVEASPFDSVWGIGVSAEDPRAADPNEWPGLNLLGFALMNARRLLSK
jgi:ribA/ribD-fused uncharacterized protein